MPPLPEPPPSARALLDRVHEVSGFKKRLRRTRIEPGITTPELFDIERTALEIRPVDVGDFKFAPRRRLDAPRDVDDLLDVKIEPRDRPARLRGLGLLDDIGRAPLAVEADDAIPLRITHLVAEYRRSRAARTRRCKPFRQPCAKEHVVAEDQRAGLPGNEIRYDDERLRQAVGARLLGCSA